MAKFPLILVGDYSELATGDGGVNWYDDDYTTYVAGLTGGGQGDSTCIAYLTPLTRNMGSVFIGDNLGRIFQEDESQSYPIARSVIASSHIILSDAGGGDDEGKKLVRCWSYVEAEDTSWTFRVWTGDERAYPPFLVVDNYIRQMKQGGESILPSELTGTSGSYATQMQPKTVHSHQPEKEASGRGFTFEYRFYSPKGVKFYGFGGVVAAGRTRRPVTLATYTG